MERWTDNGREAPGESYCCIFAVPEATNPMNNNARQITQAACRGMTKKKKKYRSVHKGSSHDLTECSLTPAMGVWRVVELEMSIVFVRSIDNDKINAHFMTLSSFVYS